MMPESAVKALAQLRANGHFTAIATGRLQASAAAVAAHYGFTDIVADGGWSVTHNGEIVEMLSLIHIFFCVIVIPITAFLLLN